MASNHLSTSNSRQIARAATIMMALFVVSRAAGLAREMIIGARFGTGSELDAYLAAFRVPDLIFQILAGGALGSSFLPVFKGCLSRNEWDGAWRLFSAILNLVVVLMTVTAVVAAVTAPWLVANVLAPGFTPTQQALTVSLMRWMLVSTVLFGISGIMMGVLNSFQHFILPALAPVLYNLAIIAGAWFLAPELGVYGLVLGVIVGAALHLDLQLFGMWWYSAEYRPVLAWQDPNVREVARLMGPRILGLAAVQLNFWINTMLASGLPAGSLSALNYAWLLMLLPQGVVAQAVATAAFPTFAELEARGQTRELRGLVSRALRGVLFLTLPAAAGLFVWRVPLVRLTLERGAFSSHSTDLTAYALAFYAFGLIGHSVVEVVSRAFYALHDTKTPVLIGIAAMGANAALSLLLRPWLAHGGLALANTLATSAEMVFLLWLLTRRMAGLEWRALGALIGKAAIACLIMAVPLAWAAEHFAQAPVALLSVAGLGGGALLYLAAAALLRIPEVGLARNLLRKR
jgi:putative peptidoglycan lipid II flippase